jgi:heme A synthase
VNNSATYPRSQIKKSIIVLSFISIALVFSTMLVGRYLSSTINERGLGCPDWPLCPNQFGLPEDGYLIEYIHRVLAVVASGLVYATAIVVPSSLRNAKLASIIAAIVISVQIILGYLTVTTRLYPLVVATHLSTGITVIAFSLITFYWIRVMKKTFD